MAIIGVVTMVTVPSFVRSIRGNRLRAAARNVVMAGRYARSMALLEQRDMLLGLDLEAGKVTVTEAAVRSSPAVAEPAETEEAKNARDEAEEAEETAAAPAGRKDGRTLLTRVLDAVTIAEVDVEGGDEDEEARRAVLYMENGRCTPYVVRLADEHGGGITVEVDGFGTPTTRVGDD